MDLVAIHGKSGVHLDGEKKGELGSPARAKATEDSPRELFLMVAWPNVNWTLLDVAILVSIARLGKSSQTFLYFPAAGLLARMIY